MPIFFAGNNFLGVMGTSLAMLGYLRLLSQTNKVVTYYSVKTGTVTPAFYFILLDILSVINNCAKF